MAQDKAAEIINFNASREAAANDGESAGAFLASVRAAAGLSIEAVSDATKVKVAHLQSIEAMRPDLLPPLPYVIGFVKAYARHLGLDAEAVAMRFRDEARGVAPPPLENARQEKSVSPPSGDEGARLVSVFAILAIAIFAVWVLFQVVLGGSREDTTIAATSQPRVTLSTAPAAAPQLRSTDDATPEAVDDTAAELAPTSVDDVQANDASSDEAIAEAGVVDDTSAAATEATIDQPVADGVIEDAREAVTQDATTDTASRTGSDDETPPRTTSPANETATIIEETPPPAVVRETPRPLPRRAAEPTRPAPRRQPTIIEASLVRSVAPSYPERCAGGARPIESVTVGFDINAAGRAINTRVISSTNRCFESEAERTLGRWRFNPRTVDGEAAAEAGKSATLNFRK